jgi:TPP-dependent pyruvate/acetoin dehydrogenase alpha subunit
MLTVYYLEERCNVFVRAGKISFHASCRGHEKLQIAMAMFLRSGKDWVFPYYREKALMVGLGLPLEDIFLHMLSKADDPSGGGRNMSEHFSSSELRIVSPTACTGTQYLAAVGMAKAIKKDGRDEIVYVSSGEGATSEGEFFEALNYAGREKLPVLFVVQNNGYAISVPQAQQTGGHIHHIAEGFPVKGLEVDGTRFTEMYRTVRPLIEGMRQGAGPLLIEGHAVRLDSHSSSDDQTKYRSEEELEAMRHEDPITYTAGRILSWGLIDEAGIRKMHGEVKAQVDAAADAADAAAGPDPSTAMLHIYSDRLPAVEERAHRGPREPDAEQHRDDRRARAVVEPAERHQQRQQQRDGGDLGHVERAARHERPSPQHRGDHDQQHVHRALPAHEAEDHLRADQPPDEEAGERHPVDVRREQRQHGTLQLTQARIRQQWPEPLDQPQHQDRHRDERRAAAWRALRRNAAAERVEDRAEDGTDQRAGRVQRQVAQARHADRYRGLQQLEPERQHRAEQCARHDPGKPAPARLDQQRDAEAERNVQQHVVEHVAAAGACPAERAQRVDQRRPVGDEAERVQ